METIAIEEIPGRGTLTGKRPYAEWVSLPVGRAVEVELNGLNITGLASTIGAYMARHQHFGMRVVQRRGHLYVARAAEDKDGA